MTNFLVELFMAVSPSPAGTVPAEFVIAIISAILTNLVFAVAALGSAFTLALILAAAGFIACTIAVVLGLLRLRKDEVPGDLSDRKRRRLAKIALWIAVLGQFPLIGFIGYAIWFLVFNCC